MEIEIFKKLKFEMEVEIAVATQAAINNFRKKTGMTPNYVSIEIIEISEIGTETMQNYVGKVKTTVDI